MRALVEAAGYPQAPSTVNVGDNTVWAVMFGASLGDSGNVTAYIQKEKEIQYFKVSMTYLLVFGMVVLKLLIHMVAVDQVQYHGVDLVALVADLFLIGTIL